MAKLKDELKKQEDFKDFINCIRLEIGQDQRFGGSSITTCKIPDEYLEHLDAIQAHLEVDGRTFSFNSAKQILTIDSSECEVPDRD